MSIGLSVRRSGTLSKAAIAKVNNIIQGATGVTDPRVSPMAQSLGITFNGNNNVTGNTTTTRLGTAETDINNLEGRATTSESRLDVVENQIAAIASVLGITFNPDGTLATEAYTAHTHSYEDDNGTTTDTKTTAGVS